MAEAAVHKEIVTELKAIREDIDYIKKHITDVNVILTDDDLEALKEADIDLKCQNFPSVCD